MNLSALVLGFAVAAGVPALAADADLDDLMRTMTGRRHGAADFVERHYLAILKNPVQSSGTLLYDAPDHLEMHTLLPRNESLVLDAERLSIVRGGQRRVLDLKSLPQVRPFITGLRATLAGDGAALTREFRVQFSGDLDRWTLLLEPVDPAARRTVSQVRIMGNRADLTEVEIRQPDGDRSLMTLKPKDAP